MDIPPLPGDDPLARDTRGRLFELLGQLGRLATTDELAEALALHPNGVRRHLEHLQRAGLIRREGMRQRRGRPKDGWSIDPDARPGGDEPRGYEELGRWLARAIPAQPGNLREVEATGRAIGRELPIADTGPPVAAGLGDFERAITWLGFAPHREDLEVEPEPEDEETVSYRLTNCPYRQAVEANQPVVCTLHKGILSGLLETLEPGAEITGFRPRDPRHAGCTVAVLRRRPAQAGPTETETEIADRPTDAVA
jgi:predicted ArsR family transcriptional regulator